MTQFESGIKMIPYSQEQVYGKLSDLNNLEAVKDRIPTDKVQDLQFDADTVSFSVSPVGRLSLRIVNREAPKCIKFEAVKFTPAFQLVDSAAARDRKRMQDETYHQGRNQHVPQRHGLQADAGRTGKAGRHAGNHTV